MSPQIQYEKVGQNYSQRHLSEFAEARENEAKTLSVLEKFFKATSAFYRARFKGHQIGLATFDQLGYLSDKTYKRIERLARYHEKWKKLNHSLNHSENSCPFYVQADSLVVSYANTLDARIKEIEAESREDDWRAE